MDEKYSSNVLSSGKLGMVEVPNARYVYDPAQTCTYYVAQCNHELEMLTCLPLYILHYNMQSHAYSVSQSVIYAK